MTSYILTNLWDNLHWIIIFLYIMETNVHQMIAKQDLNFITKSYVAFENFSYKGMQRLFLMLCMYSWITDLGCWNTLKRQTYDFRLRSRESTFRRCAGRGRSLVCPWGWFLNSPSLSISAGKNSNLDRNHVKSKLIPWFAEIGGLTLIQLDLNFFSVCNLD